MNSIENAIKWACGVLLIGVIGYFYWFIFQYSFNSFFAPDDAKIFIKQHLQFKNRGIGNIFQYLLSVSLYPHPKLTARLFALLSELFTGAINFRFIQIIGNTGIFLLLLCLRKVMNLKYNFVPILCIAFLLFIPIQNTFWTISIASLPWLFIFILLSSHYFTQGKIGLSILFTFITVFTSGQGFLILPVIGIIWLSRIIKNKSVQKNDIIWIVGSLAITLFFYLLIVSNKTFSGEEAATVVEHKGTLSEYTKTYFSFFSSSIIRSFQDFSFSKNLGLTVGLSIFGMLMFLAWYTWKNPKKKGNQELWMFAIYFILLGSLAVFTRLSDKVSDQFSIPARYEIHSIMFLVCTVSLIIINFFDRKWVKYSTLIATAFLYINKAQSNFEFYADIKDRNYRILRDVLTGDTRHNKNGEQLYKIMDNALEKDLYKIPSEALSGFIDSKQDSNLPAQNTLSVNQIRKGKIENDKNILYISWYYFNSVNSSTPYQKFMLLDQSTQERFYFTVYQDYRLNDKEKIRFANKIKERKLPIYHDVLLQKSAFPFLKGNYTAFAVINLNGHEITHRLKKNITFDL